MLTRIYNMGVHTSIMINPETTPLVWLLFWSRQLERDRNQAELARMATRSNGRRGGRIG